MKKVQLTSFLKPVVTLFRRFHLTLFIVFITTGLGYAVYTFNNILKSSSTDSTYTSPLGAGSIDQATLDRIKALHTSDAVVPNPTYPPGRINPFSE